MAPLKIPSYITNYLPDFIKDHLPDSITDNFQRYNTDHLLNYIKDYIPQNIAECNRFLDTVQDQCVPLSSVVTAIIIYSAITLLLSW
jgi:hypothetical protein